MSNKIKKVLFVDQNVPSPRRTLSGLEWTYERNDTLATINGRGITTVNYYRPKVHFDPTFEARHGRLKMAVPEDLSILHHQKTMGLPIEAYADEYHRWLYRLTKRLGSNMAHQITTHHPDADALVIRSGNPVDVLMAAAANMALSRSGHQAVPIIIDVRSTLMDKLRYDAWLKNIGTHIPHGNPQYPSNTRLSPFLYAFLNEINASQIIGTATWFNFVNSFRDVQIINSRVFLQSTIHYVSDIVFTDPADVKYFVEKWLIHMCHPVTVAKRPTYEEHFWREIVYHDALVDAAFTVDGKEVIIPKDNELRRIIGELAVAKLSPDIIAQALQMAIETHGNGNKRLATQIVELIVGDLKGTDVTRQITSLRKAVNRARRIIVRR